MQGNISARLKLFVWGYLGLARKMDKSAYFSMDLKMNLSIVLGKKSLFNFMFFYTAKVVAVPQNQYLEIQDQYSFLSMMGSKIASTTTIPINVSQF